MKIVNIKKFLILGMTLMFGAQAYASQSSADDILDIKVSVHQITAEFFSYQANKDDVDPAFDNDFATINALLSKVGQNEKQNEKKGEEQSIQYKRTLAQWNNFHTSLNNHIKNDNYAIAHAVQDMIEHKKQLLIALTEYQKKLSTPPSKLKLLAYEQSILLTQIIEKYSKISASVFGEGEGDWADIIALSEQFDSNMYLLEKQVALSDPLNKKTLAKVKLKWKFISPAIKEHAKRKSIPFVVVRYGNDMINKLMAMKS